MQKNTAGKWVVFAWTIADGLPKAGNAAQITANIYIDGGSANPIDDTNPLELGAGYYIFDITAAETNGDNLAISPVSSTPGIQVIGVPGSVWTREQNAVPDGAFRASVQFYVSGTITPMPGVAFDIYNANETVKMNGSPITSDSLGKASFFVNDGTYKIRSIRVGTTFSTASITVSGADVETIVYGTIIANALQTLFGNVRRLNWAISIGDIVSAKISRHGSIISGALIQTCRLTAAIDSMGDFTLTVPKNAEIIVSIAHHGDHTIITDDSDSKDIAAYLS